MSYILRGLGLHRYQAPLVTGGLGLRYILLPGGIVIATVSNRYAVVVSAGPYPILARAAALVIETQMTVLSLLKGVRGLLTGRGAQPRLESGVTALRVEGDAEEAEHAD